MKKCVYLLISLLLVACGQMEQKSACKVNLILDTDMAPDYDDVGAMALMYALADSGQVNVLATVGSNKDENVAPCIEVINRYFNRPDMPVGTPKGEAPSRTTWHQGERWTEYLPKAYPHKIANSSEAPDAVGIYRKVLSSQPDESVTICTTGFFTNLKNLLQSKPDAYSPLDGKELIKKKVKLLVSMAGEFPESVNGEFNVKCDAYSAYKVAQEWPTDIIFYGFEIGVDILTGKEVAKLDVQDSPVKDTYEMCLAQDNPEGRNSWDQTAVLVAIKGYAPYYTLKKGTIIIDSISGANRWIDDAAGKHACLVESLPDKQMAEIIENYMKHQPVTK